jgi:hypothetical protein
MSNGKKPLKLTEDFWQLLELFKISKRIPWDLTVLDGSTKSDNPLNVKDLDISWTPSHFDVLVWGESSQKAIRIDYFLNKYFPNKYPKWEIDEFIKEYNKILETSDSEVQEESPDLLKPRPFKFEPLNVKETFISLVTETYPMGHEDELLPFITPGLSKDEFGNYYMVIGNSDVAFTSHLDTASLEKNKIGLIEYEKDGETWIKTDGNSILGADDKAGVVVLMYMIAKRVPGVYWFFYGEERGGQGSSKVANNFDKYPFMRGIKKVVSFDRRNFFSVITQQLGAPCCSNEFALELCAELGKAGLRMNIDPTGVFTDSANFVDLVPECTNVSVGYFNEHRVTESQNITFLEKLAEACTKVNWSGLKTYRQIGEDTSSYSKYNHLLNAIKRGKFNNKVKYSNEEGKLIITLEVRYLDVKELTSDIDNLQKLLKDAIDPQVIFDEDTIKIILN